MPHKSRGIGLKRSTSARALGRKRPVALPIGITPQPTQRKRTKLRTSIR